MKRAGVAKKRALKQTKRNGAKRSSVSRTGLSDGAPTDAYRVGPGRPPREFQFKPGQSGNPKGAKRKTSTKTPNLKELLERTLNEKIELGRAEGGQTVTKAVAGVRQLVDGFARGDRSARRDLIQLAQKLGVDLTQGQSKVLESALADVLAPDDAALLDDYFRRHAHRHFKSNPSGADLPQLSNSAANDGNENEGKTREEPDHEHV